MEHTNPMTTPLDLSVHIKSNPEPSEENWSNPFTELLEELQYLTNCMQPDIFFTVNRLAPYTANPSLVHYGMLK